MTVVLATVMAITICGLLGGLIKKMIPENWNDIIMNG